MSKSTIRVLIVEHSLPFYHIPSWELLGTHPNIDLTIAFGQGFFTGKKYGVPEGKIPTNTKNRYFKCNVLKTFFGKKYLWHNIAIDLVKNEDYDIVIHQAETKLLSLIPILILSKTKNFKLALWGIGNPLRPSPVIDQYRRLIAKISDAFIFYSEINKNKYLNWKIDAEKLFVAKNSINVEEIIEFTQSWTLEKESSFKEKYGLSSFTILTIGRLQERKKIDWLIRVGDKLKELGYEFSIIIIGDGLIIEELKNLVNQLDLQNNVHFTGKIVGIQNIGPWFMSSDIIVAPAQVGHLATESHAYGKPIILSDKKSIQGPESDILINEETGFLYKHGDLNDLTKKIEKLMQYDDLKEKYASRCQKRAHEFAGTKMMVNGFLTAISRLTGIELMHFK